MGPGFPFAIFFPFKKVNGKNIKTLDGLISFLRGKKAGDEISIEIIRNGQTITLEFLLDLRPSDV